MHKILILFAFNFLFAQSTFVQNNLPKREIGGVCNIKATYLPLPSFARQNENKKISGSVSVQLKIDKEGNVKSARAITGSPLLHKEAKEFALKSTFPITRLEAAKQAKFNSPNLSGRPIKARGILVFNYN